MSERLFSTRREETGNHTEQLARLEELSQQFTQEGFPARVLPLAGEHFYAALIFSADRDPNEKRVRVFRGVNNLDTDMLNLIPYTARTVRYNENPTTYEETRAKLSILDELIEDSNELAHNPTYENLLRYSKKARPFLSESEQQDMDREISDLEDKVLAGQSLGKNLFFKQIEHGGAVPQWGISPTTPATFDPFEPLGYIQTQGAILVIDVPLSEISDFTPDSLETCLRGKIDPKYISAAIMVDRGNPASGEGNSNLPNELEQALSSLDAELPSQHVSEEEAAELRMIQYRKNLSFEEALVAKDREAVAQKRALEILEQFPEVNTSIEGLSSKVGRLGLNIYEVAKNVIFDFYAEQLSRIGESSQMKVINYGYRENDWSEWKNFVREKVDDFMLRALREKVQQLRNKEIR